MRIFRYKCDLPVEMVLDRFERFLAIERHNPFNLFRSFYNPRVGIHTYRTGNEVSGYYENGIRNRHDSLQTFKVWFQITVKPRDEGCTISGAVFSSPYFFVIAFIMLGVAIRESFVDPLGAAFVLSLAAVCLFFEALDQGRVCEQIRALAPASEKKLTEIESCRHYGDFQNEHKNI